MDPASVAGLLLQTSQLALQSGTAIYQFVQDAQNVNGHVAELVIELNSLADACRTVREQLRSLAKQYKCYEGDNDEDTSLWSSIKNKLDSCNATLRTLEDALGGFPNGGSNFVSQGVRQFKLNLRQPEIIAMKGRIHSHTSALQVCLLVMDIKVSHLASRKVGTTLGKKLNQLGGMMNELKTLLEAQRQPVEEQSVLNFEDEEDAQLVTQNDGIPVPELVRVDSASGIAARRSINEDVFKRCIDSDTEEEFVTTKDRLDQLGDDLVLQCAQETLSRATSLYEESLYEGSVEDGDASDSGGGMEKQLSTRQQSQALRNGIVAERELNCIEILDIPDTGHLQTAERPPVGGMGRNKGRSSKVQTPATGQILPVLTDEPLNMPSQIQASFRKLQEHFQRYGSSTIPKQLTSKPTMPTTTLSSRGTIGPTQRSSLKMLKNEQKSSQQHSNPNEVIRAIAEMSNSLGSPLMRCATMNTHVVDEKVSQSPLRYLYHIEQELEDFSNADVSRSRHTILQKLLGNGSKLLPTDRVALTGRLGIGKSYVAAAHVHRLIRRFETVPIFWISASHIEDDCKAISELVRLKSPKSARSPWNWLSKIIASLPRRLTEPWLVVVDGVNLDVADNTGLQKLLDVATPKEGYLLMTTRYHGIANRFLRGGLSFDVDTLNGEDAGNLLSSKSPVPRDFEFDMIASALDFDPFVTTQVRSFLEKTGMPIEEFSVTLELVLDDQNWAREGQATVAAKALSRQHRHNGVEIASSERYNHSALVPVLRAILNLSWLILFDALHEKQPAAAELLSILSVLGRSRIPDPLVTASAGDKAAAGVLLDQYFLTETSGETFACRLMLITHRVWLVEQGKMEAAYRAALKNVANEYPAIDDDTAQDRCKSLEPFAEQILCNTASSWIPNDRTSEMYISMLKEKRKKTETD